MNTENIFEYRYLPSDTYLEVLRNDPAASTVIYNTMLNSIMNQCDNVRNNTTCSINDGRTYNSCASSLICDKCKATAKAFDTFISEYYTDAPDASLHDVVSRLYNALGGMKMRLETQVQVEAA